MVPVRLILRVQWRPRAITIVKRPGLICHIMFVVLFCILNSHVPWKLLIKYRRAKPFVCFILSMIWPIECIHSIDWSIECVHSITKPLNVYIPQIGHWMYTFNGLSHWMYTFNGCKHSIQHIHVEKEQCMSVWTTHFLDKLHKTSLLNKCHSNSIFNSN